MDETPGVERFSLSGRIALVTGATRVLGLEIAHEGGRRGPDEVVGAAVLLASDAASYITGQVLTVGAGLSIAL